MIFYALLMMLFGGGNMEVFYIDKIDQGVKEYVTDNERKKEGWIFDDRKAKTGER